MIRRMVIEQCVQKRSNSSIWKGPLISHIEKYIREIIIRKEIFIIRQFLIAKIEIEWTSKHHEVDIKKKECTYGF